MISCNIEGMELRQKTELVCGLWFVVCGLWFVICDLWFVVCGLWFVVEKLKILVKINIFDLMRRSSI